MPWGTHEVERGMFSLERKQIDRSQEPRSDGPLNSHCPAPLVEFVSNREQVLGRAPNPIQFPHHKGGALAQVTHTGEEMWAIF